MKTFFLFSIVLLALLSYRSAESVTVPSNGMLFEKITRIHVDNPQLNTNAAGSWSDLVISNEKQMVILNNIDMTKEKNRYALEACERSARLVMARPDKYRLLISLTNVADVSSATKKIFSFIDDTSDKQYFCDIITPEE